METGLDRELEQQPHRNSRKPEARQAWGSAWTGRGPARRGRSQGCDFISPSFLQRQLCLVWGLCLDPKGLVVSVLTLFRPRWGSLA